MMSKTKVIIYGAGYAGLLLSEMLSEKAEYEILWFMDKDQHKKGKQFNDIPIKYPEKAQIGTSDILIIVGILDRGIYLSIKDYLEILGYENICYMNDFIKQNNIQSNRNLIFNVDYEMLKSNIGKIESVYNKLGDDFSKETYKKIFLYLAGNESVIIPSLPYSQQYFAYDVYRKDDKETFIDCGAFKGDILKYFIENNQNRFCRYIAIEPDCDNVKAILDERLEKDIRIVLLSNALSNKREKLYIRNYMGANSVIINDNTRDSDKRIAADTLDNIIVTQNLSPTFIKIDTEGYEEKILAGGDASLKLFNPVVSIAVYHKVSDLWQIPLYFIKTFPSNKFYLRSYMNVNETVFYSVPPTREV